MPIPKNFHQIWIGPNPLPPSQRAIVENNFKILGSSWNLKLWTNDDLTQCNFPRTWKYIKKSLLVGKKRGKIYWAQISDLMRYEILYHHGGIYMDVTMQIMRNLDRMITYANANKKELIVSHQEKKYDWWGKCEEFTCRTVYWPNESKEKKFKLIKHTSNSFIGAIRHSKPMERLTSEKKLKTIDFNSYRVDVFTGPVYLRSSFKKSKSVWYIPTEKIYPIDWAEVAGANDNYHLNKSKDKCVSTIKTKTHKVPALNQRKERIYLSVPCKKYPKAWAVKHWDIGGTWK